MDHGPLALIIDVLHTVKENIIAHVLRLRKITCKFYFKGEEKPSCNQINTETFQQTGNESVTNSKLLLSALLQQ